MLVKFDVDPQALQSVSSPSAHRRFIQCWQRLGILIKPADGVEHLEAGLEYSRQAVRKLWKVALMKNRCIEGPASWPGLGRIEQASDLTGHAGALQLACCGEQLASALGMSPSQETMFVGLKKEIEVALFDCVDQSDSFRKAEEHSVLTIPKGTPTEQIWQERFALLASTSKHITIVDRYCLQNMAETPATSGLRRFLVELDRCPPPGRVVQVFSARELEGGEPALVALRQLISSFAGGGLKELELHSVPAGRFWEAHDRSLRFEETVVELGQGLDVLATQQTKRSCTFTLKHNEELLKRHRALEDYLARVAHTVRLGARPRQDLNDGTSMGTRHRPTMHSRGSLHPVIPGAGVLAAPVPAPGDDRKTRA